MQGFLSVCRIISKDMKTTVFSDWRYVEMRKIIGMGAALVLMLSVGMTASAWHHATGTGRMIQGSGLCHYQDGTHHLFWHEAGQNCAFWDIDVSGICDNWEYCHGGAGTAYGQQGADGAAQSQSAVNAVPESQPAVNVATENPAEAQTGYEAGAAAAESYGTGYQYYNGGGYGNGGYCAPGNYATGCHGSGHHGRGHH